MSVTTRSAPTPLPVQVGLVAWLASAFVVMFLFGHYEPGVGARGVASGLGVGMLGVYFLVCATVCRDFALYRLKVFRITRFFGDEAAGLAHALYGVFGVGFIVLGAFLALR